MKITFLFFTTKAKKSLPGLCAILSISDESHSFAAEAAEIALKYFVYLHVCICPQLIITFWVLHTLQEAGMDKPK